MHHHGIGPPIKFTSRENNYEDPNNFLILHNLYSCMTCVYYYYFQDKNRTVGNKAKIPPTILRSEARSRIRQRNGAKIPVMLIP